MRSSKCGCISENEDVGNIVRSLDPINESCYNCLFTNFRTLALEVQEKQINESQVATLLVAACHGYMSQLTKLQAASTQAMTPGASFAQSTYGNLTTNVKNTLNLLKQMGDNMKQNPDLKDNKTAYCSELKQITDSIRNFNTDDRESIADIYSPLGDYILTTGKNYTQFSKYLDMVDTRCGGNMTEEEQTQLTQMTLQYNIMFRDNVVPYLNTLSERLDALTIDSSCLQDKVLVRVAGRIANATVKDFNARINSNDGKQKLNAFISKSNEFKNAASDSA